MRRMEAMNDFMRLEKVLRFLRLLRRKNRLFQHHLTRDYLFALQESLASVLNCRVAYGGSTALFLQGLVPRFGDYDIVTDRILRASDLPWRVNEESQHGLKVHRYDLDIFFVADRHKDNRAMLELSNRHVVTMDDGVRVQDAEFVMAINRMWHVEGDKQRLCAERVEPELLCALRMALEKKSLTKSSASREFLGLL